MKDLSSGLRASLAMAVCAALLAPAAAADNGKNPPGEHPGNSATAPGQEKRQEPASAPEPAPPASSPPAAPPPPPPPPPPPAPAPEPVQTVEPATSPASTQHPARPEPSGRPHGSEKPKPPRPDAQAQTTPTPGGSSGPPRESTAHEKVLICHATGSATNPYVVISVSVNAWSRGSGHGAHPGDVFIDWSWPGDPRQKDESLCPSRPPETSTPTPDQTTPTPAAPTNVPAATASSPSTTEGSPAVAPPAAATDPRSGSADPASWSTTVGPSGRAGRVLATTSRLGRAAVVGTLPFTGVPLWATIGVGIVLIAGGVALRRRSRPARALPSG